MSLIKQSHGGDEFQQQQRRDEQADAHAVAEVKTSELLFTHAQELRVNDHLDHPDEAHEHPRARKVNA